MTRSTSGTSRGCWMNGWDLGADECRARVRVRGTPAMGDVGDYGAAIRAPAPAPCADEMPTALMM